MSPATRTRERLLSSDSLFCDDSPNRGLLKRVTKEFAFCFLFAPLNVIKYDWEDVYAGIE